MSVVLEKELPKGWTKCTLIDIAEVILGQSPPSSTYNADEHGLPFFQGKLEFGLIHPTPRMWCSKPNKIAEFNDILLSVRAPVGATNLANQKCCIGRGLCAIRCKIKVEFTSLFLLYFFKNIEKYLDTIGTGTTFKAISGSQIRNLILHLPPLNEQKRIVAKIEELFSLVDSAKENLEKTKLLLKQYRQSILKHAFEGKLTEELRTENKTSNQWQILSLDQVSDVIDPHPSHRAPPEEFEGFPFVGIGDIDENGNINLKNCRKVPEKFISQQEKSYEIKDGSIGYARVGTVGKVVKLKKHNFRYSLSPTLSIINSKENIFPKFLFYQLQSNLFFQQVRTNLTGTTRDAIGITKLRKIQVYIPSLNEQKKIATKIEESFSIIEKNEKLVDSLLLQYSQIKNSILKQAFKGKLVPQDPNDEPAQILLEKIQQERKKNGK